MKHFDISKLGILLGGFTKLNNLCFKIFYIFLRMLMMRVFWSWKICDLLDIYVLSSAVVYFSDT